MPAASRSPSPAVVTASRAEFDGMMVALCKIQADPTTPVGKVLRNLQRQDYVEIIGTGFTIYEEFRELVGDKLYGAFESADHKLNLVVNRVDRFATIDADHWRQATEGYVMTADRGSLAASANIAYKGSVTKTFEMAKISWAKPYRAYFPPTLTTTEQREDAHKIGELDKREKTLQGKIAELRQQLATVEADKRAIRMKVPSMQEWLRKMTESRCILVLGRHLGWPTSMKAKWGAVLEDALSFYNDLIEPPIFQNTSILFTCAEDLDALRNLGDFLAKHHDFVGEYIGVGKSNRMPEEKAKASKKSSKKQRSAFYEALLNRVAYVLQAVFGAEVKRKLYEDGASGEIHIIYHDTPCRDELKKRDDRSARAIQANVTRRKKKKKEAAEAAGAAEAAAEAAGAAGALVALVTAPPSAAAAAAVESPESPPPEDRGAMSEDDDDEWAMVVEDLDAKADAAAAQQAEDLRKIQKAALPEPEIIARLKKRSAAPSTGDMHEQWKRAAAVFFRDNTSDPDPFIAEQLENQGTAILAMCSPANTKSVLRFMFLYCEALGIESPFDTATCINNRVKLAHIQEVWPSLWKTFNLGDNIKEPPTSYEAAVVRASKIFKIFNGAVFKKDDRGTHLVFPEEKEAAAAKRARSEEPPLTEYNGVQAILTSRGYAYTEAVVDGPDVAWATVTLKNLLACTPNFFDNDNGLLVMIEPEHFGHFCTAEVMYRFFAYKDGDPNRAAALESMDWSLIGVTEEDKAKWSQVGGDAGAAL